MPFNVAEFRANMNGDGARPNLFEVSLTFPTIAQDSTAASQKTTFMAKTAQLPGSTVGTVPVFYFGRELKFAGNRSFTDWSVSIINDEDFVVRDMFEAWHNAINTIVSNRKIVAGNGYTSTGLITQYGKSGNIIKQYEIFDMFPINIGDMTLDWESQNQIQQFGVTFAYNYWVPVVRSNGTAINPVAV